MRSTLDFGGRGSVQETRAPGRGRVSALPADDPVGLEDQVEESRVIEISRGEVSHGHAGRECWRHRARKKDDGDGRVALAAHGLDDGPGQGRRVGLQQVQDAGHQKTMKRDARAARAAIPAASIGVTGWASAFQVGSEGRKAASMWKGTPSFLSEVRTLAMSSPSTRSSVSSS